ncbi:hypothetical protein [Pseudomonas akapageensis]|nr:hypothetical protein [Pseudomonas akapageensis]
MRFLLPILFAVFSAGTAQAFDLTTQNLVASGYATRISDLELAQAILVK